MGGLAQPSRPGLSKCEATLLENDQALLSGGGHDLVRGAAIAEEGLELPADRLCRTRGDCEQVEKLPLAPREPQRPQRRIESLLDQAVEQPDPEAHGAELRRLRIHASII